MFARILATGDVIIHTPDALVHHRHRVDEAGLDKQIRGNGSGMAALLTKAIIAKPSVLVHPGDSRPRRPQARQARRCPRGRHRRRCARLAHQVRNQGLPRGPLPVPVLAQAQQARRAAPGRAGQRARSATAPSSAEEAQASSAREMTRRRERSAREPGPRTLGQTRPRAHRAAAGGRAGPAGVALCRGLLGVLAVVGARLRRPDVAVLRDHHARVHARSTAACASRPERSCGCSSWRGCWPRCRCSTRAGASLARSTVSCCSSRPVSSRSTRTTRASP